MRRIEDTPLSQACVIFFQSRLIYLIYTYISIRDERVRISGIQTQPNFDIRVGIPLLIYSISFPLTISTTDPLSPMTQCLTSKKCHVTVLTPHLCCLRFSPLLILTLSSPVTILSLYTLILDQCPPSCIFIALVCPI